MLKKQSVIVKMLVITIFMLMTSMSGVVFANEDDSTNGHLDISKIDEFMTNEIERLNLPGASLAIIKGNQIEYLQGYGIANTNGTNITPQTPMLLGQLLNHLQHLPLCS